MSSRNISLKEEAYRRLKEHKKDDESFSDVVIRLTKGDPNDFSNLIGVGIDADWGELEESRKRGESDNERMEKLSRQINKQK